MSETIPNGAATETATAPLIAIAEPHTMETVNTVNNDRNDGSHSIDNVSLNEPSSSKEIHKSDANDGPNGVSHQNDHNMDAMAIHHPSMNGQINDSVAPASHLTMSTTVQRQEDQHQLLKSPLLTASSLTSTSPRSLADKQTSPQTPRHSHPLPSSPALTSLPPSSSSSLSPSLTAMRTAAADTSNTTSPQLEANNLTASTVTSHVEKEFLITTDNTTAAELSGSVQSNESVKRIHGEEDARSRSESMEVESATATPTTLSVISPSKEKPPENMQPNVPSPARIHSSTDVSLPSHPPPNPSLPQTHPSHAHAGAQHQQHHQAQHNQQHIHHEHVQSIPSPHVQQPRPDKNNIAPMLQESRSLPIFRNDSTTGEPKKEDGMEIAPTPMPSHFARSASIPDVSSFAHNSSTSPSSSVKALFPVATPLTTSPQQRPVQFPSPVAISASSASLSNSAPQPSGLSKSSSSDGSVRKEFLKDKSHHNQTHKDKKLITPKLKDPAKDREKDGKVPKKSVTSSSVEHGQKPGKPISKSSTNLTGGSSGAEYTEEVTRCLCGRTGDQYDAMISCDTCRVWQHLRCVGMTVIESENCEKYFCERCSPQFYVHQRREASLRSSVPIPGYSPLNLVQKAKPNKTEPKKPKTVTKTKGTAATDKGANDGSDPKKKKVKRENEEEDSALAKRRPSETGWNNSEFANNNSSANPHTAVYHAVTEDQQLAYGQNADAFYRQTVSANFREEKKQRKGYEKYDEERQGSGAAYTNDEQANYARNVSAEEMRDSYPSAANLFAQSSSEESAPLDLSSPLSASMTMAVSPTLNQVQSYSNNAAMQSALENTQTPLPMPARRRGSSSSAGAAEHEYPNDPRSASDRSERDRTESAGMVMDEPTHEHEDREREHDSDASSHHHHHHLHHAANAGSVTSSSSAAAVSSVSARGGRGRGKRSEEEHYAEPVSLPIEAADAPPSAILNALYDSLSQGMLIPTAVRGSLRFPIVNSPLYQGRKNWLLRDYHEKQFQNKYGYKSVVQQPLPLQKRLLLNYYATSTNAAVENAKQFYRSKMIQQQQSHTQLSRPASMNGVQEMKYEDRMDESKTRKRKRDESDSDTAQTPTQASPAQSSHSLPQSMPPVSIVSTLTSAALSPTTTLPALSTSSVNPLSLNVSAPALSKPPTPLNTNSSDSMARDSCPPHSHNATNPNPNLTLLHANPIANATQQPPADRAPSPSTANVNVSAHIRFFEEKGAAALTANMSPPMKEEGKT